MNIVEWLKEKNINVNNELLIRQSFMHSSYANEHKSVNDNERLEFMGDAVLQVWVSNKLFRQNPILNEGEMTRLRARLVCEQALAIYARELGLQKFLLLGQGEEKNRGRNKDSILADMFEAFIGALYIDQGIDSCDILLKMVMEDKIKNPSVIDINADYKTKLQEFVQTDTRKTVTYEIYSTTGPSNRPLFKARVKLEGLILGYGEGNSKKSAEQDAAKDAFEKMVK